MPAPDCFAKAKCPRDEWPPLPPTPAGILPTHDGAALLLQLPAIGDSCNNCSRAHAVCLFGQHGHSCPVCLLKDKPECSWALRSHFVQVIRLYRDGRLANLYSQFAKNNFKDQFYADCQLAFLMFDCERSGPETTIAAGYFAFLHCISDSALLSSILLLAYKYQCDDIMIKRILDQVDECSAVIDYQAFL
ncbi:hypothetical protein C8R46DRAFT_1215207 [Mycena filopes]|nr:hypothetical protein C8R46DRAFT_1235359 [Mycena filopes]KAJ7141979.1 hypothetical protein C8R46DRAFT_1233409 [Mycena filopes]KAJ7173250.1 hypothetical protein C8R46DRAFT_1215207 [Mycena filopes]